MKEFQERANAGLDHGGNDASNMGQSDDLHMYFESRGNRFANVECNGEKNIFYLINWKDVIYYLV